MHLTTREPKGQLITVSIQDLARQRYLHNQAISTTMYDKKDPWRSISTTNLRAKGEKWYSVIQPTTAFIRSHIGVTVKRVSRLVASESAENL